MKSFDVFDEDRNVRNQKDKVMKAVEAIALNKTLPKNLQFTQKELISHFGASRSGVYSALSTIAKGGIPRKVGRHKRIDTKMKQSIISRLKKEKKESGSIARATLENIYDEIVLSEESDPEVTSANRPSKSTFLSLAKDLNAQKKTVSAQYEENQRPSKGTYENLYCEMEKLGIGEKYDYAFVFNMDETYVASKDKDSSSFVWCFEDSESRLPFKNPKTHVTMVNCIGVDFPSIPPAFIVTRELLDDKVFKKLHKSVPIYFNSDSGWMSISILLDWAKYVFVPSVEVFLGSRRALLILDGHSTHVNEEFVSYLREHHIDTFVLPPNCTQYVQPLDCGIYAHFKRELRRIRTDSSLEECVIAARRAWTRVANEDNIHACWRRAGFFSESLEEYLKKRKIGKQGVELVPSLGGKWKRVHVSNNVNSGKKKKTKRKRKLFF